MTTAIVLLILAVRLLGDATDGPAPWIHTWLVQDLDHPARGIGAGLGILVTAATASIAISIGALIPLYNRGVIQRCEMVPYILGAKIGTHSDTFLVAAALGAGGSAILLARASVLIVAPPLLPYPAFAHHVDAGISLRFKAPSASSMNQKSSGAVLGIKSGVLYSVLRSHNKQPTTSDARQPAAAMNTADLPVASRTVASCSNRRVAIKTTPRPTAAKEAFAILT